MALSPTINEPSLLTRAQVVQEYNALRNRGHCPIGMYIMPSTESEMVWEAVLFIHKGKLFAIHQYVYISWVIRILRGCDSSVSYLLPKRLPFSTATGPVRHRRISSTNIVKGRNAQHHITVRKLEVRGRIMVFEIRTYAGDTHRPTEHRIFHVLHWIKSVFKKEVLDNVQEGESLNKEAYRYAAKVPLPLHER